MQLVHDHPLAGPKLNQPTVVILLSDKRSGSTIFQTELCKHDSVASVDYSPHTYEETQHWLKAARLLGTNKEFYGHEIPSVLKNRLSTRQYTADCIAGNVSGFSVPAGDRELVFDGWETLCTHFARPVFFEKSPQHLGCWAALSLMMEWIQTTKFKVRVIGLIRNPLSVMYSADNLFMTDPKVRQFYWADMYRNLLALKAILPPEQLKIMRYEDVIASPISQFAEVCEFIGVEAASNIGADVHVNSKNKWIGDLEYDVKLTESVKQIARHFGYSDEELNNPDKPGVPQFKKIKGRVRLALLQVKSKIVNGWLKPLLLRFRRPNR